MTKFEYTEKGHRYMIDNKLATGVTTILGVIAKKALIGWAAKQTAVYIREHCEHSGTVGNDAIYTVSEGDLKDAGEEHQKKKVDGGSIGKATHEEVEKYIKACIALGELAPNAENPTSYLKAFALWARNNNVKFLSSETPTYSVEWFVGGCPDFTFEKDGKKFVGDLKTYGKIWDRTPHFQCAAYAKMLTEHGEGPFAGTVIVNINKETSELTDSWTYDLEGDIKAFEAALLLYRQLSNF